MLDFRGPTSKRREAKGTVREGKNSPLYASQVPTVESD